MGYDNPLQNEYEGSWRQLEQAVVHPQAVCIVGCYSLHLYCAKRCTVLNRPIEYTGTTLSNCRKQARKDGWLVSTTKDWALCPQCRKKDGEPD